MSLRDHDYEARPWLYGLTALIPVVTAVRNAGVQGEPFWNEDRPFEVVFLEIALAGALTASERVHRVLPFVMIGVPGDGGGHEPAAGMSRGRVRGGKSWKTTLFMIYYHPYETSSANPRESMQMKRLVFATLLAVAAAGCGDRAERALTRPDGAQPRLTTISSVNVCCSTSLYIGGSGSVFADVYDTNGQWIANPSVLWWSSNNAVASVLGSGRFATVGANGAGTAIIYASVNGVTGSTTVQVRAAPVVTTVQVTPSPVTVYTGTTQPLTARAYDQYGNQMSGQTAAWSTANSGVATVSSTGVVTGVAPGTTTINATIAGKTASASITVANAIVLGDIYGPDMILTGGTYTWGITSVSGGNGTYTYEWQIDWIDTPFEGYIPLATGGTLSRNVTGCDGSFRIGLLVVSGNASAWKNYEVENFASASMCS